MNITLTTVVYSWVSTLSILVVRPLAQRHGFRLPVLAISNSQSHSAERDSRTAEQTHCAHGEFPVRLAGREAPQGN